MIIDLTNLSSAAPAIGVDVLALSQKVCNIVGSVNRSNLRWLLLNDDLPPNAVAKYDQCSKRNGQYSVWVRNFRGNESIQHRDFKSGAAIVETYEVSCTHNVMSDIDELSRSIARKLMDKENAIIAKLLEESFAWEPYSSQAYGSAAFFNTAFCQVEHSDLMVKNILYNPEELELFKEKSSLIDSILLGGRCLGHLLWTSDMVPCSYVRPGFVIVLAEPNMIGVVAERMAPHVLYDKENDNLVAFIENGYGVINPYAGVVCTRSG